MESIPSIDSHDLPVGGRDRGTKLRNRRPETLVNDSLLRSRGTGLHRIARASGRKAKEALLCRLTGSKTKRLRYRRPADAGLSGGLDEGALGQVKGGPPIAKAGQLGEDLGRLHQLRLGVNDSLSSHIG